MKITKDIMKLDFFNTTMQLFQRGDVKLQQELLLLIKNNKEEPSKLNDILEKYIDLKEIKDFIYTDISLKENKNISKLQQEEILNEYKEKYFLEKSRYEKYIKEVIPDKSKYENGINNIIKIDKDNISTEELIIQLNDQTNKFRERFNQNRGATNRRKFSLVKDNKEIISRRKKINKTLEKLNREDKYFQTDFNLLLAKISTDIVERYCTDNNLMYLDNYQRIEETSEAIQKIAQSFNNIKLNNKFGDEKIIEQIKNLNKNVDFNDFNTLQGKGDSAGKDFYYRSREVFRQNILMEEENPKIRRNKVLSIREKNEITKTLDENFKEEFRNLLINLLKISDVNFNSSSKSLFINQTDFSSYLFLLNKDKINSFLNISLDTKGNNIELINILLNFKNIDETNVLNVINNKPKEKINTYKEEINNLKQTDLPPNTKAKKIENVESKIDEILKVKEQYKRFITKYGEFVSLYIESELLDIMNYSIDIYSKDMKSLLKLSPDKIKESLNNTTERFLEIEEIESFFNVLSEIKHSIDKNYLIKEKLKFSFNKNKDILKILDKIDDFKIKDLIIFNNKEINNVIDKSSEIEKNINKISKSLKPDLNIIFSN